MNTNFVKGVCGVTLLLAMTGIAMAGRHRPLTNATRLIYFNGKPLSAGQVTALEDIERASKLRLPDGAYWYDRQSGLAGPWKGPAGFVLPPYMDFGPSMPARCSGGGTSVFVNGRELHPAELAWLSGVPAMSGARFSMDPHGNIALEAKASRAKRFGQRVQNAVIMQAQIEEAKRQQAAAQNAAQNANGMNTNQNGGRAKYAMDGIHVGSGYYMERGGGSATKY